MILLLTLAACVRLEPQLDNSTIQGTVEIPPTQIEETKDNANFTLANAIPLGPLGFGATQILGKTTGFGMNGDEFAPTSDEDWFLFNPPPAFPDEGCELDDYLFDTLFAPIRNGLQFDNPPLPKSMVSTFTLELADPSATVRMDILDLDVIVGSGPSEGPIVFQTVDVTGSGGVELCLRRDGNYAIHTGGVSGSGTVDSTLTMTGLGLEASGLKVGAWTNGDVNDRGPLLGGTDVHDFVGGEAADDWIWTGTYDIFLVRGVTTDRTGKKEKTTYDEEIRQVWLFAGNWASLDLPLPAGTWYSATPSEVKLNKESKSNHLDDTVVYSAETLVIDSIAPLVIGQEFDEQEPNDADSVTYASWDLDPADMGNANDLGVLSTPGEVDIVRGTTPFESPEADWIHDHDLFRFQVPVSELLYFNLDWSDGDADFDAIIYDSSGAAIDWMITYDKPELGGGYAPFVAGDDYFLVILPWTGPDGATVDWELIIEGAE